jgi:hypothetical protein
MTNASTDRNDLPKRLRRAAEEALRGYAWVYLYRQDNQLARDPMVERCMNMRTSEERCLALCFMAAMVEAGDA